MKIKLKILNLNILLIFKEILKILEKSEFIFLSEPDNLNEKYKKII